jgi:probable rRNA maturation factor
MAKVKFHYADVRFKYNRKTELKSFIETLFKREKKKLVSLDYIFCSDEYLLQINQSHLNHDTYTDIITFDLSEEDDGTTGEIYISIDRVKDNAAQFNNSFFTELLRVVFHGALHLCGYKDKKKEHIDIMRKKENQYIGLFK